MGSKNPRLQFTDAELSPKLKKHVRRAERAADKAEKARAKIPRDRKKLKRRMIDQHQTAQGQPTGGKHGKKGGSALHFGEPGKTAAKGGSVLCFEDVEKPAPSKLQYAVRDAPGNTVLAAVHREIGEHGDDNVGVESAHRLEETAEAGARLAQHSYRSHKMKPYRDAARAERRLEKANINALYHQSLEANPQLASNPLSRWQQRQAIKREYIAARRAGQTAGGAASAGKTAAKTAENSAKAAKKAAEESQKAASFIARHKKGFAIAIGFLAILAIFLNMLSSCSVLVEGMLAGMGGSSFVSRDEDMLGAEAAYAGMEAELQHYLDTYTNTHSYDEYHFDLDEIKHDPYVLISLLTAYYKGEWTLTEAQSMLDTLFDLQYTLTETVVTETRYDSDDEPYTWYICYVTLVNNDLSHLPVLVLDEDGMEMYATYIATQGNRPDLFPSSEYPNVTQRDDYLDYDVPPEALEDEQFAAMLAEAEKYLGFPYVWGGSSPSTSFDCSGFVSWVINHSGWNVGRLGAKALCNLCTPVSPANAKPGDLVFFINTYDAPDPNAPTHCGIYVGNNMMIHCGDPISYANLNSSYWQNHFYCYGRLPAT